MVWKETGDWPGFPPPIAISGLLHDCVLCGSIAITPSRKEHYKYSFAGLQSPKAVTHSYDPTNSKRQFSSMVRQGTLPQGAPFAQRLMMGSRMQWHASFVDLLQQWGNCCLQPYQNIGMNGQLNSHFSFLHAWYLLMMCPKGWM